MVALLLPGSPCFQDHEPSTLKLPLLCQIEGSPRYSAVQSTRLHVVPSFQVQMIAGLRKLSEPIAHALLIPCAAMRPAPAIPAGSDCCVQLDPPDKLCRITDPAVTQPSLVVMNETPPNDGGLGDDGATGCQAAPPVDVDQMPNGRPMPPPWPTTHAWSPSRATSMSPP